MTSHLSRLSLVITIRDNGRRSHLLPLGRQIGSPQEARDANLLVLFITASLPGTPNRDTTQPKGVGD